MAITKDRKDELVAQYKDLIAKSDALILAEYTGMSVRDMEDLRSKVRDADGALYVTKNTLLRLALEEAGAAFPEEMLSGQLATGFALGEVPALAKVLVDYAEKQDKLTIRGGLMQMDVLSAGQVQSLAKLPSLDELRAQLLGMINAPARNIASVIAGGVRQVVNVVDAYARSGEAEAETA